MNLICATLVMLALTVKVSADDPMQVPPFSELLDWGPAPDRTMVVSFPGIAYRYQILAWGTAAGCNAVEAVDKTDELRWLTRSGWFAHEYFTKRRPMAYKIEGTAEWIWMVKKTRRICVEYDYIKLKCKRFKKTWLPGE